MDSVFDFNLSRPKFNPLQGDIKTDVLIVGGGIAGLLCAALLKNAGVDCVVAEADRICQGVTGYTTAKITYQHGAVFDQMLRRFGGETASRYLEVNKSAIEKYRSLSKNIDCDFEGCTSYVYSLKNRDKIEREVDAINRLGGKAEFTCNTSLPFKVVGAAKVQNQAQFNPLKFLFSIAKDLKIFENTRVLNVTPYGAVTDKGKITADKTIIATHFPIINKHGGYFLKMYQHRSYVIALQNAQKVNGMYVDESENGLSFRNYKDCLLLGGGGHRTGKQGGNWQELRKLATQYYPDAKEVCFWATQDCKTLDDVPYIGQYSKNTPNLFVTTGFNKWGMTSSMVSAMILTDMILGRKNEFADVFLPSRSILHKQLAINTTETVVSLLTPKVPRCPHLGCALKYNKYEHSWDCACHGSRFSKDGKLLDNPATKDLEL